MCGMVGIISDNMLQAEVTIFKQLLAADVVRGKHATGVACIDDKTDEVSVTKRAIPAHDFLDMSRMTKDVNVFQRALLGHNRHATQGASGSHDGAHPFTHGPITLMHNGSLRSRRGLIDSKDFVVDSENICHTFANKDYMDVIPELDGAFCLIWHDERDNCIRFVRNTERPLTFAVEKTRTQHNMYYASEKPMLEWILDRNHTSAEYYELTAGIVVTVHPDMSFVMDKVELYTAPKKQYPVHYGNQWQRQPAYTGVLQELGLIKGDDVEIEITQCEKTNTPHGAPTRYQWKGHLLSNKEVVIRAYSMPSINKSEVYMATATYAYAHNDGTYNINVNNLIEIPNTEHECEVCNEKIESNQSFVTTVYGKMHADCHEFFMKDDELKEAEV